MISSIICYCKNEMSVVMLIKNTYLTLIFVDGAIIGEYVYKTEDINVCISWWLITRLILFTNYNVFPVTLHQQKTKHI